MNSLERCPNTPDLFDSGSFEPQATAAAVSDLEQQAKAFARQLAAKAIRDGFQPTHLHTYTDATDQPLYWKTRAKHPETGEKWIRAFHHDGAAFIAKEPTFDGKKPLYRLHELLNADAAQAVYICEGEQKADFLASLGLIATTSGGKASANVTDWQPLAARQVIIWPDFDDAGQSYQADVSSILSALGCDLSAVEVGLLDLPPKGDVIDWQQQRTDNGLTTTAADVQALPVVDINSKPVEFDTFKTEPLATDEQPATLDTESELNRLASLSVIEYEQQRSNAAKALGMRASALDRIIKGIQADQDEQASGSDIFDYVKPWDEPVNGAALLDELTVIVNEHIACTSQVAHATALWIAFTWCIEAAYVAPIACITAPEKQCGKTQLLTLIGMLCSKPLGASNITAAALFRSLEKWQPTLLLDETDTYIKDNEELRGVINSGHSRNAPYVIRTTGDNHEPTRFNVFGAKCLSGIGHLPDTLKDRSILLELRRKLPTETRQPLRHRDSLDRFNILKSQLLRWSNDNIDSLKSARPECPQMLSDRAQDNWEILLAIADLVGDHWPKTARMAAVKMSGIEEYAPSINEELLSDIKAVFDRTRQNRIFSTDLLEYLCADEESAWATWNKGRPMAARQLSKRLEGFGIIPKNIRIGTGQRKGYDLTDFHNAFVRYIPRPTVLGVPASHDSNINGLDAFSSVLVNKGGTDEITKKSIQNKVCSGGTDKIQDTGQQVGRLADTMPTTTAPTTQ
ncbi:MAG: DUF3631 domain-containing protein, partial [Pseudomonadota bacterium]|nr:DUF3631 domain-containing protein [Pseudomonadota bacterium]